MLIRRPTFIRRKTRIVTRPNGDKSKGDDDIIASLGEIVELLTTEPNQRSSNALKALALLTQNIPFFIKLNSDIDKNAHINCCQYMRFTNLSKGDFVFHVGDEGDQFYIIIAGSVKVLVPTPGSDNELNLTEVLTLNSGDSFGELALLKNQPRAASILCADDVYLATLDKKDYLKILGEYASKKLEEMVKFLSNLPAFEK